MTTLLLHNPKAGEGGHGARVLCDLLHRAGHDVAYRSVKDKGWKDALRGAAGWDLVVVAGGDGTVAKVARVMPPGAPPLAVLPLGGANNIARSLGVTGAMEDMPAAWSGGARRRLDIGVARGVFGGRSFVEAAGFGLLPAAMAMVSASDVESAHKVATGRRMLADLAEGFGPGGFHVTVDDHPLPEDLVLVEAANIVSIGPNLPLAPKADPGDGLLDVAWLPAGRAAALVAWLADPDAGAPPFEVTRGRTVCVRWTGGLMHADDDFLPPPPHPATVTAELIRSVEILVPDGNGGDRP